VVLIEQEAAESPVEYLKQALDVMEVEYQYFEQVFVATQMPVHFLNHFLLEVQVGLVYFVVTAY
jgi:hypothetical protein